MGALRVSNSRSTLRDLQVEGIAGVTLGLQLPANSGLTISYIMYPSNLQFIR